MTSDPPGPEQPTPPEEPPAPAEQPPPPAPAPAADADRKAGGGLRALGILLALVLAFGAAVMILVAVDIGDTSTCDDFLEDVRTGQEELNLDDECFDGSSSQKAISVGLAWASGIVGAVGVLLALMFTFTGRRGSLLARVVVAAVVLAALSIVIGSV